MTSFCESSEQKRVEGASSGRSSQQSKLQQVVAGLCLALSLLAGTSGNANANAIVVSHDINTLGSFVAGSQEERFAVNVADFLTAGNPTKSLLLFESNPGDGTRNFAPGVLAALTTAGFSVSVTSNYATPFSAFDALFIAQDFPTVGFLDNAALVSYVSGGGSVYLAGGVGPSAAGEAAGWSAFLNHYGLAFAGTGYNGINSVSITSSHPIFTGTTALGSGNGQSIIDLGTNSNAHIVQFSGTQGVYAVVNVPGQAVPEPATTTLASIGLIALLAGRRRTLSIGIPQRSPKLRA
jgi:hypothetical protein